MKTKKKILKYLKERRINTSVPTIVRFKTKTGDFKRFNAKKCGQYVVRWENILKAFRKLKKKELRL